MNTGAGYLNRRVDIQTPTVTKDSTGGVKKSWSAWKENLPAEFMKKSGKAFWDARKTNAEISDIIRVRQYAVDGINPNMRVVMGTRIMSIISIMPDDKFQELTQIMVKENID
jgi:SPP1 family predicted phage head-tail adaptor